VFLIQNCLSLFEVHICLLKMLFDLLELGDEPLAKPLFLVLDQRQLLISLYFRLDLQELLLFLSQHALSFSVFDANLNIFRLKSLEFPLNLG
jgi:hypothetical protein